MYLIKVITMFGIIIICTYLGYYKAKTYENRVVTLNQFQNALIMLKSKMEFTHEPLKIIFEDISRIVYENKKNIFEMTISGNKDIYTSWNNAVYKYSGDLTLADKEIIKMLGKLLGKTDISGQINEIEMEIELIKKQIKNAETEREKNCKLYKTMGAIVGLGICIILA